MAAEQLVEGVSAVSGGSDDEEGEHSSCRYCFQPAGAAPELHLVMPCHCSTPVHQQCLVRWTMQRMARGGRQANTKRCEVCLEPWTGLLTFSMDELHAQLEGMTAATDAAQREAAAQVAAAAQAASIFHSRLQQVDAVATRLDVDRTMLRQQESSRSRSTVGQLEHDRAAKERQVEELKETCAKLKHEVHGLKQRLDAAQKVNKRLREDNLQLLEEAAALRRQYRTWYRIGIGLGVVLLVGGGLWVLCSWPQQPQGGTPPQPDARAGSGAARTSPGGKRVGALPPGFGFSYSR